MPTVSVIIPTYNRAAHLIEAIESVLAQTYRDFEILVVDDGSTDDTEAALAPYMSRIRYFKQDNSGVSVARNRGMLAAGGEYIAFLDSDDLWYPEKLEKQIAFMRNRPEIGMCYTDYFLSDDPNKAPQSRMNVHQADQRSLAEILSKGSINLTSTIVFHRGLLSQIGLMDSTLFAAEDYDFWWRIIHHTRTAFLDEILVFYREHPNRSIKSPRMLYGNVRANSIQLARWNGIMEPTLYDNMSVYAGNCIERLAWHDRECDNIRLAGKNFLRASVTGKFRFSLFIRGLLLFSCPWIIKVKQSLFVWMFSRKHREN